jgi:hypothetical protein
MSTLNLDILLQSVDKLANQYEKNLLDTTTDQLAHKRASALLEGLNGMFGFDDIAVTAAGSLLCITVVIDDYELKLFVDPAQDLKLQTVQVVFLQVYCSCTSFLTVCINHYRRRAAANCWTRPTWWISALVCPSRMTSARRCIYYAKWFRSTNSKMLLGERIPCLVVSFCNQQ